MSFLTSFSTNRMSSFTEFATKPDWFRDNHNNRIVGIDEGNNYVSGLDNKVMN